jgi:hypothetical protein
LAVVGQQPTSLKKDLGQINGFEGRNLDSILRQIRVFQLANLLSAKAGEAIYVSRFQ